MTHPSRLFIPPKSLDDIPQNSTFGGAALLESLGVKSPLNPRLDPSIMQQVIIVADLSNSFASQKFEQRGVISPSTIGFGLLFGFIELLANAPGGIVIESIQVKVVGGVDQDSFAARRGLPVVAAAAVDTPEIMQVGGVDTTSLPRISLAVAPVTDPIVFLTVDGFYENVNFNWFIPSGTTFHVSNLLINQTIQTVIQWREIPQVPGSP